MAKYKLLFTETFYKNIKVIPAKDTKRIWARIEELSEDPRPAGSKKLSGQPDRYRLRQGNYRIIYAIEDQQLVVVVVKVGNRRDIYER